MVEMQEGLKQFGLEVEPSKTAIIRFGSQAAKACKEEGNRMATFNFLGFTHYVGKSRQGRFKVGRTMQRERITKNLKEVGRKRSGCREEKP